MANLSTKKVVKAQEEVERYKELFKKAQADLRKVKKLEKEKFEKLVGSSIIENFNLSNEDELNRFIEAVKNRGITRKPDSSNINQRLENNK